MATHSSILAWESPRTEEPGELQFMGVQELDKIYRLNNNNRSDLNSWVGNLKNNMKSLQCWEYVFSREDDIPQVISLILPKRLCDVL